MGQEQAKNQPPPPVRDTMDILLDLRMTQKRLEGDARRSEKEAQQNIQKAKKALEKNNEEGARLFLQTASTKKNEQQNLMKMAQKIELIQTQVKSASYNQMMMQQLSRITPIMVAHTNQMPIEQLYQNMTQFDNALDDVIVQGRVMDSMMNKGTDVHTNIQVDMMLEQMKQENRVQMEDAVQTNTNTFQQLQGNQVQQQNQFQYQPQQQQFQGQKY